MSQAVPMPINKTLVVDPLCDQQVEAVFAVEKSASIQNFYNIQSNNVSANSITYVVNCNSESTITDRVWMNDVEATFVITFGSAEHKPPANGVVLRPFALANCATSIVLQQGNASNSIQSSEITSALQRYGFMDKYLNYAEANPSLDMTAPYEDGQAPFTTTTALIGNQFQERGATSYVISASYGITEATTKVLTMRVRILEPVLISPLLSGLQARREGLRRISQYQLQYNFGSWVRALSICPKGNALHTIVSIEPTVNSANLNLLQALPAPLDVGRTLSTQIMPYTEFVAYSTKEKVLPYSLSNERFGASVSFSSDVIQVSRIPEGIFIYCRPKTSFLTDAKTGAFACDTFATYITNTLSVNFNGVNQFQNCSDISLYRLCRQNGCNIPWPQWSSSGVKSFPVNEAGNDEGKLPIEYDAGVGSVIYLKLSKDITLDASLAPSCNTKVNLQIQCSFANPITPAGAGNIQPYVSATPLEFVMYTVIEYSGCQETYSANTVATTIGVLSTDDVLTATKRNERVHYSVIDDGELYGGASFLDRAKKFLTEGKLRDALIKLKSYFSSPLAKEIFKTGKEYLREREGADQGTSQLADVLEEAGLGMSGGKRLSKAQLRKALLR
jgi:hypothetical protein